MRHSLRCVPPAAVTMKPASQFSSPRRHCQWGAGSAAFRPADRRSSCQPCGRARMGPRPSHGGAYNRFSPLGLHWRRREPQRRQAPCFRIESKMEFIRQSRSPARSLFPRLRTRPNRTGTDDGSFLCNRPQRDWASRVERLSLMPSVPSFSTHPRDLMPLGLGLGRGQTRAGRGSSRRWRKRRTPTAVSSHAVRQMTCTQARFIRELTGSFSPRPAAMPVPGLFVWCRALLEGFHDLSS